MKVRVKLASDAIVASAIVASLRDAARLAGGPSKLARITGIPLRTLNNYLAGVSEPRAENLAKIAQATDFDLYAIFGMSGERKPHALVYLSDLSVGTIHDDSQGLGTNRQASGVDDEAPGVDDKAPGATSQVNDKDGSPVSRSSENQRKNASRQVVAAISESDLARRGIDSSKACTIRANGDFMSPTIGHDDVLIIDQSVSSIGNGGIFVVVLDRVVCIRRLMPQLGGSVRVTVDNLLYSDHSSTVPSAGDLNICGQVRMTYKSVN